VTEAYDANDLAAAIIARVRATRPPVTYAQIANGHDPQLELMERASEPDGRPGFAFRHTNIIALCSRRAAKSTSIMALLAMDASEFDGVQIYFGKTKPAVRLSIWQKVWKPLIKKHFHVKGVFEVVHNETMMTSTFPNGAIVAFTGTDDKAHVETYLGNKLRRAVIDEAQSQPPSVLKPLIDEILPPALSDVGAQLIVAGTIPEVPAGTFYELWQTGIGWLKRNWSRFQNPHLGTVEEQMEKLQKYLQTSGHKITDSIVRRDWFGEFVFDTNATAYAYDVTRNQYTPVEPEWLETFLRQYIGDPYFAHLHRTIEPNDGKARHGIKAAKPWPGIEVFSCAIDPGATSDRFSVQVNGWGSAIDKVQHVFEFSSERAISLRWSQIDPIRRLIQEMFGPSWWYYDAGGSKVVLDTFVGDTGLPALMPAPKSGLHGQVNRVSDLLLTGILQVMKGSALEEDYQKARWNADARAKLQWRWDSAWHPDASESERYGLTPFVDIFEPPEDPKSEEEQDRELHAAAVQRRAASRMGNVSDEDMDRAIAEEEQESQWD
jgi:hypothetical protein